MGYLVGLVVVFQSTLYYGNSKLNNLPPFLSQREDMGLLVIKISFWSVL